MLAQNIIRMPIVTATEEAVVVDKEEDTAAMEGVVEEEDSIETIIVAVTTLAPTNGTSYREKKGVKLSKKDVKNKTMVIWM